MRKKREEKEQRENRVAIISGATATGKSALAIALAKKYGQHIINFDSLLFYRELNIGTAKPTLEERGGVPHHLMDSQSAKRPINAAQFSQMALNVITSLHQRGIIPLLVGGSAFYLNALLKGMDDKYPPSIPALKKSHTLYQKAGIHPFLQVLREHDPINFHKLHPNDHYRIRRAVEYYWSTGRPFSSAQDHLAQTAEDHQNGQQASNIHSWNLCHIYLLIEKHRHWDIIRLRSEKMVKNGLIAEVFRPPPSGIYRQGKTPTIHRL